MIERTYHHAEILPPHRQLLRLAYAFSMIGESILMQRKTSPAMRLQGKRIQSLRPTSCLHQIFCVEDVLYQNRDAVKVYRDFNFRGPPDE